MKPTKELIDALSEVIPVSEDLKSDLGNQFWPTPEYLASCPPLGTYIIWILIQDILKEFKWKKLESRCLETGEYEFEVLKKALAEGGELAS